MSRTLLVYCAWPGALLGAVQAVAAEPNVLQGHQACPGYASSNFSTQKHPAPGAHGLRLGIGCRTAFQAYERYVQDPTAANLVTYKNAAKVVLDYHASNRFGSTDANVSPAPLSETERSLEQIQRSALGKNVSKYRDLEPILTDAETKQILTYFFDSAPDALDDNDRRFAQAIILESARVSSQMGYVESLFRGAMSPSAKPDKLIQGLVKRILRTLAEPEEVQAAVDSKHYLVVVNQIRANWRSAWSERLQTGDSNALLR